jgi:hypothetical protein
MENTKDLENNEIKELLIKSWMTHDGMWFFHSLNEIGIEKTNKINKAASRSLGITEIKRFKKAFEVDRIENIDDLKLLFTKVSEIVKADFMEFSYDFSNGDELRFKMQKCFAYEGVKRIGAIDGYNCGIYDRIDGWLEGIGLEFDVSPKIEGCLIHQGEKCVRIYKIKF